jgi:hypothetical protein
MIGFFKPLFQLRIDIFCAGWLYFVMPAAGGVRSLLKYGHF